MAAALTQSDSVVAQPDGSTRVGVPLTPSTAPTAAASASMACSMRARSTFSPHLAPPRRDSHVQQLLFNIMIHYLLLASGVGLAWQIAKTYCCGHTIPPLCTMLNIAIQSTTCLQMHAVSASTVWQYLDYPGPCLACRAHNFGWTRVTRRLLQQPCNMRSHCLPATPTHACPAPTSRTD
jgi:hypothetical protein